MADMSIRLVPWSILPSHYRKQTLRVLAGSRDWYPCSGYVIPFCAN
ncbi:hypothetical protein JI435_417800 [Parastagonospora nodorum SN15]|uniref:Uncharacterized protein n=1 Tax=Phaeosphaeria nodorum (strain SN15 / ATCC MYA-4574 / FGSC 10173) TaxID=321614 RepID=A0A7U2I5F3_PHANO|nr:hypothetical protein JI435_417800 [Parastagonospora nodorum SN15]